MGENKARLRGKSCDERVFAECGVCMSKNEALAPNHMLRGLSTLLVIGNEILLVYIHKDN